MINGNIIFNFCGFVNYYIYVMINKKSFFNFSVWVDFYFSDKVC